MYLLLLRQLRRLLFFFFSLRFGYTYPIFEPLMFYGEINQNRNLWMSNPIFRERKRVVRISKAVLLCHCVSWSVIN